MSVNWNIKNLDNYFFSFFLRFAISEKTNSEGNEQ